jgi:hypothetical protein
MQGAGGGVDPATGRPYAPGGAPYAAPGPGGGAGFPTLGAGGGAPGMHSGGGYGMQQQGPAR